MKKCPITFFALIAAASAGASLEPPPLFANVVLSRVFLQGKFLAIPAAKLAGETVDVRLTKDMAIVDSIFEFDDWNTNDDVVYFPLFGQEPADPIRVLEQSKFELEIGGKLVNAATPCEAPPDANKSKDGPSAHWYTASIGDLIRELHMDACSCIRVRLRYNQPLIHGSFYYLPSIEGYSDADRYSRSWQYQMHVRSSVRIPEVRPHNLDYEQVGDEIVVFLRSGELIQIK